MKNQFAAEYAESIKIRDQYREAKASGNEAGMEAAKESRNQFVISMMQKGEQYYAFYRQYASAQDRGNTYIDCDTVIWDKDVETFLSGLRECGIEKFTFSSRWSSAVETAWLFQKHGCKLEGLVEINGVSKCFDSDEYEKVHGYLFSVE